MTTERTQAAKAIVDTGSATRTEVDVQLPSTVPADLSLVEALALKDVPGDALAVYDLNEHPDGLEMTLSKRSRVRDTIEQIRRRLAATAEWV